MNVLSQWRYFCTYCLLFYFLLALVIIFFLPFFTAKAKNCRLCGLCCRKVIIFVYPSDSKMEVSASTFGDHSIDCNIPSISTCIKVTPKKIFFCPLSLSLTLTLHILTLTFCMFIGVWFCINGNWLAFRMWGQCIHRHIS